MVNTDIIPLVCFLLFSIGLKCIVGIGHTSSIGFGSIKQLDFLSQPAPSRNSPLIHTPSCRYTCSNTIMK